MEMKKKSLLRGNINHN